MIICRKKYITWMMKSLSCPHTKTETIISIWKYCHCNQTVYYFIPLLGEYCSFSVALELDSASISSMSVSSSDMVCWGTVLDVEPMRTQIQIFQKCILYTTGRRNIFKKVTRNNSSWIHIKRTKENKKRYESAILNNKKT